MDENTKKPKSVWNDITKVWARIASVVAAVGISATFVVKIFNTSPELTYSIFAGIGVGLLILSFYVDKQTEYTHQEIIYYEQKARQDFTEVMKMAREQTLELKADSDRRIASFREAVDEIIDTTKETRRDTLRIQLLMILTQQPENVDTILKLAEEYFVKLGGDWYMTSEFNKWAKKHDIIIPTSIYQAIDETHNKKQEENK
jgi:hypothetical protein